MNSEPLKQNEESIGYLVVRVSTARGAIPLEGASVTVRGTDSTNSDVVYSLTTNSDGATEKISLPTKNRELSTVPGNETPYSLYDVDVFLDGYADLFLHRIAIFGGITSIQPAVLIPLPDNRYTDSYDPNASYSPTDSGGERE